MIFTELQNSRNSTEGEKKTILNYLKEKVVLTFRLFPLLHFFSHIFLPGNLIYMHFCIPFLYIIAN